LRPSQREIKLKRTGYRPHYRPFHDWRSVPEAGRLREKVAKSWKGLYSGPNLE